MLFGFFCGVIFWGKKRENHRHHQVVGVVVVVIVFFGGKKRGKGRKERGGKEENLNNSKNMDFGKIGNLGFSGKRKNITITPQNNPNSKVSYQPCVESGSAFGS